MSTTEQRALKIPCAACGAGVDERCRTFKPRTRPAGQPAPWPHAARTVPLNTEWSQGYVQGTISTPENLAWHLEQRFDRHIVPPNLSTENDRAEVIRWLKAHADRARET